MSALRTLPTLERGRSGQTSTCLGALTLPSRSLTNARTSPAVTVRPGMAPTASPGAAYAILDGLFQQALLHHLAGQSDAGSVLEANVARVLDTLTGP